MKNRIRRIPVFILAMHLLAGCGNDSSRTVAPSPKSATGTSDDSTASNRADAPAVVKRSIHATGNTTDGKAATLEIHISDADITGTLTVDTLSLEVTGMLDGQTARCWLTATKGPEAWRGNLIAVESDSDFAGHFTVSNSAGQAVVNGSITQKPVE